MHKSCYRNSYCQCITYIACTIPESRFNIIFLIAYRAIIMHIKNMFQSKFAIRIVVFKHLALPAAWAFHGKNAPEIIRRWPFFGVHAAKIFNKESVRCDHILIAAYSFRRNHHRCCHFFSFTDLLAPHGIIQSFFFKQFSCVPVSTTSPFSNT